jgi:hypothetical protein
VGGTELNIGILDRAMNAEACTTIHKTFALASVFVALICTAASCGPGKSDVSLTRCAFSDPEFTTSLGICDLAAEYYVAVHEWPLTRAQLEEQWKKMFEEEKGKMAPEEAKELSGFFDCFTLLDLRKKGDNLVLRYRFKIDGKTVDQRVTLRPEPTADEILHAASD